MSVHTRKLLSMIWIIVLVNTAVVFILAVYILDPQRRFFTRSRVTKDLFVFDKIQNSAKPVLIESHESHENHESHESHESPKTHTAPLLQISDEPSFESSVYPSFSSMRLKSPRQSYNIGDVVEVDIIGRDHLGRRKVRGGDRVRIWIKDLQNGACAAGSVKDNQDGSYAGAVKLLWTGNVTVVAGIPASRELIELMSQIVTRGRSPRQMLAKFEKGKFSETRNCTPVKELSFGYREVCDFTTINSDLPWYCEKPSVLTCKDWVSYTTIVKMNFSVEEEQILKSVLSNLQLNTTIQLTVSTGGTKRPQPPHFNALRKPKTRCNNLKAKHSWLQHSPVGYMYKGQWYSTQCTNTFDQSVDSFKKCLTGRTLWLFGDSTARQILLYLNDLLHFNMTKRKFPSHRQTLVTNKDRTISVVYGTHALPFCHAKTFIPFDFAKGTHVYLNNIPAKSRDIVVVHFYLHFIAYDTSVLRQHVRKTAKSVKLLKKRAPDVKVLVKGPHSFHTFDGIVGQLYDFCSTDYYKVLQDEFAFLANDVIFLDFWDLTVATESWDRHVNNTVLSQLVHQLMAFVCW